MKAWQVRHAGRDVVWHIRLVATTLEHALGPWGGVATMVGNSGIEVQNERARCMNIINDLCNQLIRSVNILSGQEERFDPEATIARLIECCDIAMADLSVSRLRQVLEDAAQGSSASRQERRD